MWTCVPFSAALRELINNWNVFGVEFLLLLSHRSTNGHSLEIKIFALIQLCRNKYLTSSRIPIKWNIHEQRSASILSVKGWAAECEDAREAKNRRNRMTNCRLFLFDCKISIDLSVWFRVQIPVTSLCWNYCHEFTRFARTLWAILGDRTRSDSEKNSEHSVTLLDFQIPLSIEKRELLCVPFRTKIPDDENVS